MKLHITTETEEGQILVNRTYQIVDDYVPQSINLQDIIDDSKVEEDKWDDRVKEIINDANRMCQADKIDL